MSDHDLLITLVILCAWNTFLVMTLCWDIWRWLGKQSRGKV